MQDKKKIQNPVSSFCMISAWKQIRGPIYYIIYRKIILSLL